MGLFILLLLSISWLLLIIKGCMWLYTNCTETDQQPTIVRNSTPTASLPDPSSSCVVRSSYSNTNSSKKHHRTARGRILITDTDEMKVDEYEEKDVSKILITDFGDGNVHHIEDEACSICLVKYQHGDRIQRSALECFTTTDDTDVPVTDGRCDHVFHLECITNWVKSSTNSDGECPICHSIFVILPPV
jgi:Anaphase-promoting complex subunit 11 RING-H2 finger